MCFYTRGAESNTCDRDICLGLFAVLFFYPLMGFVSHSIFITCFTKCEGVFVQVGGGFVYLGPRAVYLQLRLKQWGKRCKGN